MSDLTQQHVIDLILAVADGQPQSVTLYKLKALYKECRGDSCVEEEEDRFFVPMLRFMSYCISREAITFNISRGKKMLHGSSLNPHSDAYNDGYIIASLDMASDELRIVLSRASDFIRDVCCNMIFKQ